LVVASEICPAVFIGLGGAAARVLRHLRRRFSERIGQPRLDSNLRFLALDTDPNTLRDAEAAAEVESLSPDETLHLPLRKPADYRSANDEILCWLSRRWLYNIPRSLRTEGLRPLGRLAFVDHRQAIAERLRRVLDRASPRVFIIASIDGGTGGGMLFDVAYVVRQQLDNLKLTADCLCGLMLHGGLAHSPANDLRKANAYATLTELNHFMQGVADDRTRPIEVLVAGDASEPPFRDAYLIDLGNELSDAEFDDALRQVAEYLYLSVDSCGAALDNFRNSTRRRPTDAHEPARLRSFGLHAIRVDKQSIATYEADRLCLRLTRKWLGESEEGVGQTIRIQPPDFGLDDLAQRVQAIANQALGGSAEVHFRTLVASQPGRPALVCDDDPAGPFGDELRRIHAVLGLPTVLEISQPVQLARLAAALQSGTQTLASAMGDSLVESISALVEQPPGQVQAALAGTNLFQEHLRDLRQAADEILRRDQALATSLWSKLQRGELPRQQSWFSRFSQAGDDPEECLLEYCRLRLQTMVYKHLGALLQEVSGRIAALHDRLIKLRQSLHWLSAEFAATTTHGGETPAAFAENGLPFAAELGQFHEPAYVTKFDQSLRQSLFDADGGLLALADKGPDRLRELGGQVRELARESVLNLLAGVDAGSVLFQQNPTAEKLSAVIVAAVEKAKSPLHPFEGEGRLVVVIPQGPSSEAIAGAVCERLPDASIVRSTDSNLVFLREVEGLVLSDAAAQMVKGRVDCAAAAHRVLTRVDVPWIALPA
jgi:hypothetical protein